MFNRSIFALALLMSSCTNLQRRPIAVSIHQSPSEQTIRVTNTSAGVLDLEYPYRSEFGKLQMFEVRFRDASGRIVPMNAPGKGWWSPLYYWSGLKPLPRRRFSILPNRWLDFPLDMRSLTLMSTRRAVEGPCEMQIRLIGFLSTAPTKVITVHAPWRPSPCPWSDTDRGKS